MLMIAIKMGSDLSMVGANVPMFYSCDKIYQRFGTIHSTPKAAKP